MEVQEGEITDSMKWREGMHGCESSSRELRTRLLEAGAHKVLNFFPNYQTLSVCDNAKKRWLETQAVAAATWISRVVMKHQMSHACWT
eukprot:687346-Pelagomonas_calceolata.AAC.1